MRILEKGDIITHKSAVTTGVFDGMHKGHLRLFEAITAKKEYEGIVYTFKRNNAENMLFTQAEEEYILKKRGVQNVYFQKFDEEFKNTDRADFIKLLKEKYNCAYIACGEDFRFGKGAAGDASYLKEEGKTKGIEVEIIGTGLYGGEKISSTRIKECVKKGDMQGATDMLGYLYFAMGNVENGRKLGRTLDFPTVNIRVNKILPQNGVYASFTKIDGKVYASVSNVGKKPTVKDSEEINIETNIFDFDKDVYGKNISVYFVKKIRDEKKFADIEELKKNIAADREKTIEILENKDIYKDLIL